MSKVPAAKWEISFGFPVNVAMTWPPVYAGACETSEWILPSQGVFRVAVVSRDLLFCTQERGKNCLQRGGRTRREGYSIVRRGFSSCPIKIPWVPQAGDGHRRSFFSDCAHWDRAASQQEPQIITIFLFLLFSYIFSLKRVIWTVGWKRT